VAVIKQIVSHKRRMINLW